MDFQWTDPRDGSTWNVRTYASGVDLDTPWMEEPPTETMIRFGREGEYPPPVVNATGKMSPEAFFASELMELLDVSRVAAKPVTRRASRVKGTWSA